MVEVGTHSWQQAEPKASARSVANGPPTGAVSSRIISDPRFSTKTKLVPIRSPLRSTLPLVRCARIDKHLAALFDNVPKHNKDSLRVNKICIDEIARFCNNRFCNFRGKFASLATSPIVIAQFCCKSLVAGISRFAQHILKVQQPILHRTSMRRCEG